MTFGVNKGKRLDGYSLLKGMGKPVKLRVKGGTKANLITLPQINTREMFKRRGN